MQLQLYGIRHSYFPSGKNQWQQTLLLAQALTLSQLRKMDGTVLPTLLDGFSLVVGVDPNNTGQVGACRLHACVREG